MCGAKNVARIFIFSFIVLALNFFSASPARAVLEISNSDGEGYVDIHQAEAKFRPASGLVRSQKFDGFEAPGRNMEVIIALLRAPYDAIASGITKDALASKGIDVLSRGDVVINGRRGVLIKALHPDKDVNWGKWIMVLENGGSTLFVNGVFISGDTSAAQEVEAMLKSAIPYRTEAIAAEPEEAAEFVGAAAADAESGAGR